MFSRNEGAWDRGLRGILGFALLWATFTGVFAGAWTWIGGIVGIVMLVTALVGFCPAYRIFGVSTCAVQH